MLDIVREHGWVDPVKTESLISDWLITNNYLIPSGDLSIHSPESIRFMTEVIGADEFTLSIMKNGVSLDFKQQPPPCYKEVNNQSAIEHMPALRKKVQQWVKEGHVQRLDSQPPFCSPITMNPEFTDTGELKKVRPCHDHSRMLNKILKTEKISMDTLTTVEHNLYPGHFMVTFDLSNAYFNFRMRPEDTDYLGFCVTTEEGEEEYFKFLVMIYGLSPASYIITKVIRPLKTFLHRLGIAFSIFIGKFRIVYKIIKNLKQYF